MAVVSSTAGDGGGGTAAAWGAAEGAGTAAGVIGSGAVAPQVPQNFQPSPTWAPQFGHTDMLLVLSLSLHCIARLHSARHQPGPPEQDEGTWSKPGRSDGRQPDPTAVLMGGPWKP